MKAEAPVFITDIEEVRAFVQRCVEENLQKERYWTKK